VESLGKEAKEKMSLIPETESYPAPDDTRVITMLRMNASLQEQIRAAARKETISVPAFIRRACMRDLARQHETLSDRFAAAKAKSLAATRP
jgi:predicted HicB family RNase H-like nuclease